MLPTQPNFLWSCKWLKLSILLSGFHTFSKFRRSINVTAKMWVKLLLLLPPLTIQASLESNFMAKVLAIYHLFPPITRSALMVIVEPFLWILIHLSSFSHTKYRRRKRNLKANPEVFAFILFSLLLCFLSKRFEVSFLPGIFNTKEFYSASDYLVTVALKKVNSKLKRIGVKNVVFHKIIPSSM